MSNVPPGSGLDTAPDEALVRATLQGQERAFAVLVRRYARKSLAVALEYMSTLEDAEDVVQDTFRRVLEGLHRFDTTRSFGPWFFTVLRNTARNALKSRRMREHETLTPEHAANVAGPYEDARRRELRQRIGAAVERLPPMQRQCFTLCMVEGLASAEAGSALGIAESTVRVHVLKARHALQQQLGDWRDEVEHA